MKVDKNILLMLYREGKLLLSGTGWVVISSINAFFFASVCARQRRDFPCPGQHPGEPASLPLPFPGCRRDIWWMAGEMGSSPGLLRTRWSWLPTVRTSRGTGCTKAMLCPEEAASGGVMVRQGRAHPFFLATQTRLSWDCCRAALGGGKVPQKLFVSEKLPYRVRAGSWGRNSAVVWASSGRACASVPGAVLEPRRLVKMPTLTLCTYSKLSRYMNVTDQFCPPVCLLYLYNKIISKWQSSLFVVPLAGYFLVCPKAVSGAP